MVDVTATGGRQVEKSLQRELDVLNAVLDTVSALVVVLDPEGRIVRFNRACEHSTGYRFAEVEGRQFWDFLLVPEEVERVKDTFARLRASQFPSTYENSWVARDGRRRLIAWSNTALVGEDGVVEYVIGTGLDVTEQRQAEQALRESEEKLATLFEILPIGISVVDQERNVVKANPALSRILDYSPDALQRGHFRAREYFTAEGDPFPPQGFPSVRAFEEQNPVYDVEIGIAKEDGETIWTSVSAAPVSFPDWKVVITTVDITARKRAEQALRRALEASQQRQAEVSALLDGARQVLVQHNFADTARSIFDTCKDLIGATAGYVALSSTDGTANEVLFLDPGEFPCTVDIALPMPIRGLRGQVYRSGNAVVDNDFRSSSWVAFLPEGHVGVDNLLFAPLVIGGQVVGLLGLANKPGGFTANDERLATAFAELAAIALHNSQLVASLEASELRFRSVVETASAAIVTTDSEGQITFWNRMAETIFGYTAQEMLGAPLMQIIPERFRAAHQVGMYRVLSTGKTRLVDETVETIGVRKGGHEFPLEISLAHWKTGEASYFTALMHDITQRKQSEEALREAKQSMETLIKASPLAIIALDQAMNVRLWNPAAERIFGWSETEALGRRYPVVPENRQDEFRAFMADALAGHTLTGIETVRHKKDGSALEVALWTAPLYDAQGQISDIMIVIADITERKRVEAALRQYAYEQTALYAVASAVTSTLDQDALLPVVLDAVLRALEADAGWILLPDPQPENTFRVAAQQGAHEELLAIEPILPCAQCPIYQRYSSGYGDAVDPSLVQDCSTLAAGNVDQSDVPGLACIPLSVGQRLLGILKIGWRRSQTYRQRGYDLLLSIGRQVGVALHNAQLYQAARQLNRLRILSDLDRLLAATLEQRKLAQVTLQHMATHLNAPACAALLLEPAPQGPAAMWALHPEEGWADVAVSDHARIDWQALLSQMHDQREPVSLTVAELEQWCPGLKPASGWGADGLLIPVVGEDTLLAVLLLAGRPANQPFTDEDRTLALVAAGHAGQAMQNARLYAEVRRLLDEQEKTRAQLIQVEKMGALGRLAATIAHEINNPLQAIQNYLTLVQEEMDGEQRRDKIDRYLRVVGGEVGRISAIVRRMRDFYRPAHERLRPTDLTAVLDSVLDLSGKELQNHHIVVQRVDASDLPQVQANPDHLKQVFLNLILNAIDAMPTGGELRIYSSLAEIQRGDADQWQPAVRVEVGDTGCGMSPEMQTKLFEPFFTTKEQGAGLGLSISYNIIEAHNGQISVSSEEGVGTTFTLLLPLASV
ncbi:MAG: PAS domain S-box protein [Anaerolineae bacterium]